MAAFNGTAGYLLFVEPLLLFLFKDVGMSKLTTFSKPKRGKKSHPLVSEQ